MINRLPYHEASTKHNESESLMREVRSLDSTSGQESTCQSRKHETWVRSLGREDPLEQEMATCSNILAWKIPWIEEPGGLQPMRLQRVRHD